MTRLGQYFVVTGLILGCMAGALSFQWNNQQREPYRHSQHQWDRRSSAAPFYQHRGEMPHLIGVGYSQGEYGDDLTDDEIRQVILRKLDADYNTPTHTMSGDYDAFSFVGPIKKGQPVLRRVLCGAPAQPTIPVKATVRIDHILKNPAYQ